MEICFELYNPRIHEIQVVKLEKRLDDSLLYLRDALPEFSTFDVNMKPVPFQSGQEVPVNKVVHVHLLRCKQWRKKRLAENLGGTLCACPQPTVPIFVFLS